MHYFKRVVLWSGIFTIALSTVSTRLIEADIPEELRSNLGCNATSESYRLMSEEKVNHILREKLEFFPRNRISSLSHHIFSLSQKFRLDPALILSVIQVESNFKVKAKSQMGALGLMQVMPQTALHVLRQLTVHVSGKEDYRLEQVSKSWIHEDLLFNPFFNTAIGIAYLAWLRDYYHGSAYHALAAYNLGPAKLDQLISKKSFKPTHTRRYFHSIRQGVSLLRMYEGQGLRLSDRTRSRSLGKKKGRLHQASSMRKSVQI